MGSCNRRSPPVSILGTFPTIIPIPGLCADKRRRALCATLPELSRTDGKTAQYPPDQHKPQPTVKRVDDSGPLFATLSRSDSRQRKDHSAQSTLTIGYNGGMYLRLSNLSYYSPGRAEQLCAEVHNKPHTLRAGKLSTPRYPG